MKDLFLWIFQICSMNFFIDFLI